MSEAIHSSDEDDIYTDLPNVPCIDDVVKEYNSVKKKLEDEVSSLNKRVEELSTRNSELESKNKSLALNISVLYKTAVAEIQRKDKTITEIRKERDNILFRRNTRGSTKTLLSLSRDDSDKRTYQEDQFSNDSPFNSNSQCENKDTANSEYNSDLEFKNSDQWKNEDVRENNCSTLESYDHKQETQQSVSDNTSDRRNSRKKMLQTSSPRTIFSIRQRLRNASNSLDKQKIKITEVPITQNVIRSRPTKQEEQININTKIVSKSVLSTQIKKGVDEDNNKFLSDERGKNCFGTSSDEIRVKSEKPNYDASKSASRPLSGSSQTLHKVLSGKQHIDNVVSSKSRENANLESRTIASVLKDKIVKGIKMKQSSIHLSPMSHSVPNEQIKPGKEFNIAESNFLHNKTKKVSCRIKSEEVLTAKQSNEDISKPIPNTSKEIVAKHSYDSNEHHKLDTKPESGRHTFSTRSTIRMQPPSPISIYKPDAKEWGAYKIPRSIRESSISRALKSLRSKARPVSAMTLCSRKEPFHSALENKSSRFTSNESKVIKNSSCLFHSVPETKTEKPNVNRKSQEKEMQNHQSPSHTETSITSESIKVASQVPKTNLVKLTSLCAEPPTSETFDTAVGQSSLSEHGNFKRARGVRVKTLDSKTKPTDEPKQTTEMKRHLVSEEASEVYLPEPKKQTLCDIRGRECHSYKEMTVGRKQVSSDKKQLSSCSLIQNKETCKESEKTESINDAGIIACRVENKSERRIRKKIQDDKVDLEEGELSDNNDSKNKESNVNKMEGLLDNKKSVVKDKESLTNKNNYTIHSEDVKYRRSDRKHETVKGRSFKTQDLSNRLRERSRTPTRFSSHCKRRSPSELLSKDRHGKRLSSQDKEYRFLSRSRRDFQDSSRRYTRLGKYNTMHYFNKRYERRYKTSKERSASYDERRNYEKHSGTYQTYKDDRERNEWSGSESDQRDQDKARDGSVYRKRKDSNTKKFNELKINEEENIHNDQESRNEKLLKCKTDKMNYVKVDGRGGKEDDKPSRNFQKEQYSMAVTQSEERIKDRIEKKKQLNKTQISQIRVENVKENKSHRGEKVVENDGCGIKGEVHDNEDEKGRGEYDSNKPRNFQNDEHSMDVGHAEEKTEIKDERIETNKRIHISQIEAENVKEKKLRREEKGMENDGSNIKIGVHDTEDEREHVLERKQNSTKDKEVEKLNCEEFTKNKIPDITNGISVKNNPSQVSFQNEQYLVTVTQSEERITVKGEGIEKNKQLNETHISQIGTENMKENKSHRGEKVVENDGCGIKVGVHDNEDEKGRGECDSNKPRNFQNDECSMDVGHAEEKIKIKDEGIEKNKRIHISQTEAENMKENKSHREEKGMVNDDSNIKIVVDDTEDEREHAAEIMQNSTEDKVIEKLNCDEFTNNKIPDITDGISVENNPSQVHDLDEKMKTQNSNEKNESSTHPECKKHFDMDVAKVKITYPDKENIKMIESDKLSELQKQDDNDRNDSFGLKDSEIQLDNVKASSMLQNEMENLKLKSAKSEIMKQKSSEVLKENKKPNEHDKIVESIHRREEPENKEMSNSDQCSENAQETDAHDEFNTANTSFEGKQKGRGESKEENITTSVEIKETCISQKYNEKMNTEATHMEACDESINSLHVKRRSTDLNNEEQNTIKKKCELSVTDGSIADNADNIGTNSEEERKENKSNTEMKFEKHREQHGVDDMPTNVQNEQINSVNEKENCSTENDKDLCHSEIFKGNKQINPSELLELCGRETTQLIMKDKQVNSEGERNENEFKENNIQLVVEYANESKKNKKEKENEKSTLLETSKENINIRSAIQAPLGDTTEVTTGSSKNSIHTNEKQISNFKSQHEVINKCPESNSLQLSSQPVFKSKQRIVRRRAFNLNDSKSVLSVNIAPPKKT